MKQGLSRVLGALILIIFLAFSLSGCSLFDRKEATAPVIDSKQAVPMGGGPSNQRELGSLWSDSSKWNEFYAASNGRVVGDLVVLKPSETFRSAITSQAKGVQLDQTTAEQTRIIASVKEVLPRNVYRVEAKQPLRIGTNDLVINYKGKIRDQDVAPDDSANTDSVFDGQLQVENKTAEVANAQNSSEEKDGEKKQ